MCVKGKVKCDSKLPKCSRCASKGVVCAYPATKSQGSKTNNQHSQTHTKEIHGTEPTAPPVLGSTTAGITSQASHEQPFPINAIDTAFAFEFVQDPQDAFDWETSNDDFAEFLNYDNDSIQTQLDFAFPTARDQILSQDHLLVPTPSMHISPKITLRSLTQGPNIKAGARLTANLMARILNTYPMMMLRYDALPPFIHPQWISSTDEMKFAEPLTNCMSLVTMFNTRVAGSAKLFWRNVRQECKRICDEVSSAVYRGQR